MIYPRIIPGTPDIGGCQVMRISDEMFVVTLIFSGALRGAEVERLALNRKDC